MIPQKIAIIGCGYVGTALARALVAGGHDVVGTTTTTGRVAEIESTGARAAVLAVADVAGLANLVAKRDAIYLAVAAGRGGDYTGTYLAAARNLVAAMSASAVTRVIYTSSTSVYGQNDGSVVDEESPTEPAEANARVLVEAERALLDGVAMAAFDRPRTATIVRLGGIYGPGRELDRFALRAAGSSRTGGAGYVNLVHLDDIVAALVALLDNPYHGVLNLTDDEPVPRRALYDAILAEQGVAPIEWREEPGAGLGKQVRSERIKQLLGLKLSHPRA